MSDEEKKAKAAAEKAAKLKLEAEAKIKAEMEEKAKVEAEAKAKAETKVKKALEEEEAKTEELRAEAQAALSEEAKLLGIKSSVVRMAGFKSNKPEDIAKEKKRHEALVAKRIEKRIAKAKRDDKLKLIDKRRLLLVARFNAVKSEKRPNTYSNANLKAWLEEYNMIKANPKSWNKQTGNGTKPFVPGNRRKKTPKEQLQGMDLD